MQETCKAFSPLRLSEAGKEGAGPQSPAITPVRVEFVCPKEFDLAGLEVFDADGKTVAPLEGMPGKPMKGVYWLSPGSYTYNFKTGVEGYQDLTAVPFTVEKDGILIPCSAETKQGRDEIWAVIEKELAGGGVPAE